MKKSILKLKNVQVLSQDEQKKVKGQYRNRICCIDIDSPFSPDPECEFFYYCF